MTFPADPEPLPGLFFAHNALVIGFGTDHYHEVGIPNMFVHPAWPALSRRNDILVDCAIDAVRPAKDFEHSFKSLERVWEAVSPDPCLYSYRHEYTWLCGIFDASNLRLLSVGSPKVGVLFSDGERGKQFANEVAILLGSSAVVIPVVSSLQDFQASVPERLYPINGMPLDKAGPNLEAVATLVLELLGLMRKRRRLFISYKRDESAPVAQQLHHALDERSFDVFLDTLSVRAADPFQERLWHRMADSDIVILLYTQNAHSSGWVEDEIKRANGMKITVLQVIWPGVKRDRQTEMFEPHYLADADFDPDNPRQLKPKVLADYLALSRYPA
jgi:hypothetical protein